MDQRNVDDWFFYAHKWLKSHDDSSSPPPVFYYGRIMAVFYLDKIIKRMRDD